MQRIVPRTIKAVMSPKEQIYGDLPTPQKHFVLFVRRVGTVPARVHWVRLPGAVWSSVPGVQGVLAVKGGTGVVEAHVPLLRDGRRDPPIPDARALPAVLWRAARRPRSSARRRPAGTISRPVAAAGPGPGGHRSGDGVPPLAEGEPEQASRSRMTGSRDTGATRDTMTRRLRSVGGPALLMLAAMGTTPATGQETEQRTAYARLLAAHVRPVTITGIRLNAVDYTLLRADPSYAQAVTDLAGRTLTSSRATPRGSPSG